MNLEPEPCAAAGHHGTTAGCADCTRELERPAPTPEQTIAERLEHLRGEIRAERISWSELAELQSLAEHIDPGDVELLEWAGVPEHSEPETR